MRWKWIFIAPLALLGILVITALGGEIVKLSAAGRMCGSAPDVSDVRKARERAA